MEKQNTLLLTKNYPPQIGGIEKYAHDLYTKLVSEGTNVKLIAAGPRNEFLMTKKGSQNKLFRLFFTVLYIFSELLRLGWFAVRALIGGYIWLMQQKGSSLIWSMDGSISGIGIFLASLSGSTTRVTLHGTEVVWNNSIYQKTVVQLFAKNDEIYLASENTRQECLKRNIPDYKMKIDNYSSGQLTFLDVEPFDTSEFLNQLGIHDIENKVVLFSMGRWIERKGFHWFLENIMPRLDAQRFHYILAGFGPYEVVYKNIITKESLDNVTLIGKIDDPIKKAKLYLSSQLFVMPNILTEGNIEGYPLVLMEATYYGLKKCIGYVQGGHSDADTFCGFNDPEKWIHFIQNLAAKD